MGRRIGLTGIAALLGALYAPLVPAQVTEVRRPTARVEQPLESHMAENLQAIWTWGSQGSASTHYPTENGYVHARVLATAKAKSATPKAAQQEFTGYVVATHQGTLEDIAAGGKEHEIFTISKFDGCPLPSQVYMMDRRESNNPQKVYLRTASDYLALDFDRQLIYPARLREVLPSAIIGDVHLPLITPDSFEGVSSGTPLGDDTCFGYAMLAGTTNDLGFRLPKPLLPIDAKVYLGPARLPASAMENGIPGLQQELERRYPR